MTVRDEIRGRLSPYHEVETTDELRELLFRGGNISRCCFQNIDFKSLEEEGITLAEEYMYLDCLFMGCTLTRKMKTQIN